jgi:hypothetical protein
VATDQRRGCYAKILSTLRAADISNTLNEASPCATAADARAVAVAADRACTVRRAVFTVARAAARFKRLLAKVRAATMTVCVKSLDGRSLDVMLPMMSSIMTLREAVAREAELALSTVELFVTGGDGEALRDNLRLMKAVGRHVAPSTATAFMVVKTDACWTCDLLLCERPRVGSLYQLPHAAPEHRAADGGTAEGGGEWRRRSSKRADCGCRAARQM